MIEKEAIRDKLSRDRVTIDILRNLKRPIRIVATGAITGAVLFAQQVLLPELAQDEGVSKKTTDTRPAGNLVAPASTSVVDLGRPIQKGDKVISWVNNRQNGSPKDTRTPDQIISAATEQADKPRVIPDADLQPYDVVLPEQMNIDLGRLIWFALKNGSAVYLDETDFYHCHVLLDQKVYEARYTLDRYNGTLSGYIALSKQNDGFDIVIGSVFNFSHSARENDARRVRGVISP